MEQLKIISAFEEPSPWCHPIVIAPKKDTVEIRICIGFTLLNEFIQREHHLSDFPSEPVTSVPQEELAFVCKFNTGHGYWQVPLAPESRSVTCFITPFACYVCNRAAFGINSISEWYNHRMNKVITDLEGTRNIVDDILIYNSSLPVQKNRTRSFFDQCRHHGVTVKQTNSQLAVTDVLFVDFRLSSTGI